MTRAHLLARVSTAKSSQDQSPDRQLDQLRAYADRQAWEIAGQSIERTSGGKGEDARPQLAAIMAAAREGKIDVLAVTRLDRLGRSVEHLLAISGELQRLGVDLVVLDLGVDTTTAMGRLFFTILAALAQFYREIYAEAAAEGVARARAKGKICNRPRQWFPPETLAAMRLLVTCANAARSWGALSRALAREGLRQSRKNWPDRPWPPATLRRIWLRECGTLPPNFVTKPGKRRGTGRRAAAHA